MAHGAGASLEAHHHQLWQVMDEAIPALFAQREEDGKLADGSAEEGPLQSNLHFLCCVRVCCPFFRGPVWNYHF